MSARGSAEQQHLAYMVATAAELQRDLAALGRDRWSGDGAAVAAACYRLQTIGESSTRLSPVTKGRHPEIRWPELRSLRNHLAHEHLDIAPAVLWDIATRRVPELGAVAGAELARHRPERRPGGVRPPDPGLSP